MKKLPDYFLSAPQKKDIDTRLYILWEKVNKIIIFLNKDKKNKDKNKKKNIENILIEVSRMIEKRTGK